MTAPMFKVFTGAMVPYTKSVDGVERKFIKTTASSTVTDRKGHEFDVKALQKMGLSAKGMTIFLNHEYQVPEDLFGTIVESESKQMGHDSDNNPVWDLDFDVMVNEANPRAIQAWNAYEQGVRMGVSVGVIVKEWDKGSKPDIKRITDVEFLEASIVGIPANPRTWVQGAVMSINKYDAAQAEGLIETLDLLDSVADPKPTVEVKVEPKGLAEDIANAPIEDRTDEEPLDPENDDDLAGQEAAKSVTDDANTDAAEELTEESDSDPEASASGATQSAPDGEAESQPEASVVAGIDLLVDTYKAQVQDLTDQLSTVKRERDEAREASRLAMQIVERISSLPMGRKASYQREIRSFRRDLSGVYGEDFLAFLERETSA
jgi:hypothetical protein